MGVVTASLIALVALKLDVPCESVFIYAARKSSKVIQEETKLLERMAEASCQTLNPDIIWSIAHTESGFRFLITRKNKSGGRFKIATGKSALDLIESINGSKLSPNIDIGAMQINWRFHADAFDRNSFAILDPKHQVEYLSQKLAPELVESCGTEWVACYHNRKREKHKRRYRRAITRSQKQLERWLDHLLRRAELIEKTPDTSLP